MTNEETVAQTQVETPPDAQSSGTAELDEALTKSAAEASEKPTVQALRQAQEEHSEVEGKVIGWNRGGFHVVLDGLTAFCPRSEMEIGTPKKPEHYLDQTFKFRVLKVQKRGRRVVLSRAAALKSERDTRQAELRDKLAEGAVIGGRVASLTDFGAFVDLGGLQGLVHVSEISRHRVTRPQDVLTVGQEVDVKILKIDEDGKRISLSMRALQPDPWREIKQRFPEGESFSGKVEQVTRHGAFIELEEGLTGLLPTAAMSLPRDASAARAYPPGKEIEVQVLAIDERRQRISLALPGSSAEGTRRDYDHFRKSQSDGTESGFNALADAFRKISRDSD